jgi:hypothetical protein
MNAVTDLLSSLKSDLLDRRLLPVLVLLGAVFLAAVAYAVLGGKGSSSTPTPAATVAPSANTGPVLPVSQAPADPHAALSETTEGGHYQHPSGSHNPFTPLPSEAKKQPVTAASGGSSSTPSTSQSSSSSSGTAEGGTTPSAPTEPAPEPTKPRKHHPVYIVDVLFGLAPTTAGQLSQLTPYANLKRLEPLPSASDPRIVFAGVSATGKGAIFTLGSEAILNGEGGCLPSATQCEAIDLGVGKSEEFGYLEANGLTATYELKVVSIEKRQASAASAARLNRRDRAGQALMRRLNPSVLHDLHFSSAKSVLVFAVHRGSRARRASGARHG